MNTLFALVFHRIIHKYHNLQHNSEMFIEKCLCSHKIAFNPLKLIDNFIEFAHLLRTDQFL